jgi:hypothetical protein
VPDPWGFAAGELKEAILSLLPEPRDTVTALDLATNLSRNGDNPRAGFLKAVQRAVRELRVARAATSVPVGEGSQLGWHLPSSGSSPGREIAPVLAPAQDALPPHVKQPTTRKSFIVEMRRKRVQTAAPPNRVRGTSVPKGNVTVPELRERVLALVPIAPESASAQAIAESIHEAGKPVSADALQVIQMELRALQIRRLAAAIRRDGTQAVSWQRPAPPKVTPD